MLKRMVADRQRAVYWALVIMIAAGGLAAVWISTPRGVGTSPDAVNYIAASRTLLAGDGFERFNREPLERWPPLYPVMLAGLNVIGDGIGVPLLEMLRLVNGLTLAAIVLVVGWLLERYLESRLLALLGTLSILFSYAYLLITFFAYSDPIFVLLVLLALLSLARQPKPFLASEEGRAQQAAPLRNDGEGRRWARQAAPLLVAGGLVALACLQRYAGITLILAGGLCILLLQRGTPWLKRFRDGFVFGLIAATPLALWMLNNYRVTGSFSSGHLGSEPRHGIRENISGIYGVIFQWFAPERFEIGYLKVGAALIVLLVVGLVWVYWRERKLTLDGLIRALPFPEESLPVVIFVITYLAFFILSSSSIIKIKTIDDRFLSPIYAPMMISLFMLADRLAGWSKKRFAADGPGRTHWSAPTGLRWVQHAAPVLIAGVMAVWLIYPADRFVDQIRLTSNAAYNAGYDLPLIETLRADWPDGVVYSNYPLLTLIHAGVLADPVPLTLDGWRDLPPGTLVWFGDMMRCDRDSQEKEYCVLTEYGIEDLSDVVVIKTVAEFDEGGIYRVTGE